MASVKLVLRVAGIVLFFVGLMCIPAGFGTNPKRDLSGFYNLADAGMFVVIGLCTMGAGAVVFAGSYALPGPEPD